MSDWALLKGFKWRYRMTGGFSFKLMTKRVRYEFNVYRKIMRIVGDSATGKSELINVLADANNPRAGISVNCKYKCEVITDAFFRHIKEDILIICETIKKHDSKDFATAMRNLLKRYDNILFFADEDFTDIGTNEFASFCKFTDSFFVLICRDPLGKLPYSYTELYTIKTSGKFHSLVPNYAPNDFKSLDENREFIVEDSSAGYTFFKHFYPNTSSANGKSNIINLLGKANTEIIADGAAFGCEIEKVIGTISRRKLDTKLFLPESFEYLLLTSQLFIGNDTALKALNPIHEITGLYFSWERYFAELLTKLTNGFANNYSKTNLNECYYQTCCCKKNNRCNVMFINRKKEAVLKKYLEVNDDDSSNSIKMKSMNVF